AGLSQHLVSVLYRAIHGLDPHILERGDPSLLGIVERVLAALIPVAKPSERKVVTLVGPTGTGKTTTIAKLMARALLEKKQRVAVVTIDTFRIAAVEQLRAFAEMMDVPLRVAFTPQDLRQAVQGFRDHDRIFIDTTGRSPGDHRSLSLMRGFFRNIAAEVHLCLPAGGRGIDLDAAVKAYACFDPRYLVLTKCDETSAPGESLSLAIEQNHPVSFTTHGQRVPEDLSSPDPRRLASAVMGTTTRE
ncbi:MAG: AAA family ATPase, partial [Planctomycetota bacterium]